MGFSPDLGLLHVILWFKDSSSRFAMLPVATPIVALLKFFWAQWYIVAVGWIACSTYALILLHFVQRKLTITFLMNCGISWPLIAPVALYSQRSSFRAYWKPLLVIVVLCGMEKNLTNAALFYIPPTLKTALHNLNLLFTFLCASLLGADPLARKLFVTCEWRWSAIWMGASVIIVSAAGVVTAVFRGADSDWRREVPGIFLQLGSSLSYAFKITVVKMLLCKQIRSSDGVIFRTPAPSKSQIAFVEICVTTSCGATDCERIGFDGLMDCRLAHPLVECLTGGLTR